MILYFSATGNCKYVATCIAETLGDEAVSIEGLDPHVELSDGEVFGLVTPTYSWVLPSIVVDFLVQLEVDTPAKPYAFLVATFGTTPGQTYSIAQGLVKGKAFAPFDAGFCVRMPDTWTPIFDLSDAAKVAKTNEAAEPQIDRIIDQVGVRARGNFMHPRTPRISKPFARALYENMRKTSHFRLDDSCIGCGLCARRCPVQAIEMVERRPVWVKEQCVMCLRCLHHCSKFAIQYGKHTRAHGQYKNPHVRV